MIQADRQLLADARRVAHERGVTFPQLVRDALEREVAASSIPPRQLASIGVISTGGKAGKRSYEPDAWR
jgi:hypothetical protein